MKFDDEGKHHAEAQQSDHTHAEPRLVVGLSSNDIYSNGLPHPMHQHTIHVHIYNIL